MCIFLLHVLIKRAVVISINNFGLPSLAHKPYINK